MFTADSDLDFFTVADFLNYKHKPKREVFMKMIASYGVYSFCETVKNVIYFFEEDKSEKLMNEFDYYDSDFQVECDEYWSLSAEDESILKEMTDEIQTIYNLYVRYINSMNNEFEKLILKTKFSLSKFNYNFAIAEVLNDEEAKILLSNHIFKRSQKLTKRFDKFKCLNSPRIGLIEEIEMKGFISKMTDSRCISHLNW